jgi:hypothetical protein
MTDQIDEATARTAQAFTQAMQLVAAYLSDEELSRALATLMGEQRRRQPGPNALRALAEGATPEQAGEYGEAE